MERKEFKTKIRLCKNGLNLLQNFIDETKKGSIKYLLSDLLKEYKNNKELQATIDKILERNLTHRMFLALCKEDKENVVIYPRVEADEKLVTFVKEKFKGKKSIPGLVKAILYYKLLEKLNKIDEIKDYLKLENENEEKKNLHQSTVNTNNEIKIELKKSNKNEIRETENITQTDNNIQQVVYKIRKNRDNKIENIETLLDNKQNNIDTKNDFTVKEKQIKNTKTKIESENRINKKDNTSKLTTSLTDAKLNKTIEIYGEILITLLTRFEFNQSIKEYREILKKYKYGNNRFTRIYGIIVEELKEYDIELAKLFEKLTNENVLEGLIEYLEKVEYYTRQIVNVDKRKELDILKMKIYTLLFGKPLTTLKVIEDLQNLTKAFSIINELIDVLNSNRDLNINPELISYLVIKKGLENYLTWTNYLMNYLYYSDKISYFYGELEKGKDILKLKFFELYFDYAEKQEIFRYKTHLYLISVYKRIGKMEIV